MAKTSKHTGIAVVYARALLELAQAQNAAEAIGQDLSGIASIMEANPAFDAFMRDPSIGQQERAQVFDRIFRGKVAPLLMNFMGVLNQHRRTGSLARIAQVYRDHLDELLGRVNVGVTVAQPLDEAMLNEVREKISAALGKQAIVKQTVDDSIIGGLVVRVEDKLIDGSIRAQLEEMRKRMVGV